MKKNMVSPFIQLIWDIVSDPTLDHIISWSPNGTSFCIYSQELFATEILARHFKHSNLSSFVRQLNMYNFHKDKSNTRQLEFFHKLFRRDAKSIMIGIKRKPSETDQKQGEQLLRQFLIQKHYPNTQSIPCHALELNKQSQQSEEDKGSENTTTESFLKKMSLLSDDLENDGQNCHKEMTTFYGIKRPLPRIVLNIILVNKPEDS